MASGWGEKAERNKRIVKMHLAQFKGKEIAKKLKIKIGTVRRVLAQWAKAGYPDP